MELAAANRKLKGLHEHRIDDRGRFQIPDKWKDSLKGDLVLTLGTDATLWLFTREVWDEIDARVEGGVFDEHYEKLMRLLAGGVELKADAQARVMIPSLMRDWAGISASYPLVLVGHGAKIEIWSRPKWDAFWQQPRDEKDFYIAAKAAGIGSVMPERAALPN